MNNTMNTQESLAQVTAQELFIPYEARIAHSLRESISTLQR